MWETIQYITTPSALIAFLATLATVVYQKKLQINKEIINSTESKDKENLINSLSRTLDRESQNLSKEQIFMLIQKKLEYKIQKQKIYIIYSIIITIILFVATLIATSISKESIKSKEDKQEFTQEDFFLKISNNTDSLVKTENYESKLKDQLLKIFIESAFVEPYLENSNWDEILYSLTAASTVIKGRIYDFKRTPELENEFFKLNTIIIDMRNEISYDVYSKSFSIFKHWDSYSFDKLKFTTNLPKRKIVSKALLNLLNNKRQSLIQKVNFIKSI